MTSENRPRSFRFNLITVQRLNKLQGMLPTMDATTIVETALANLLAGLELGEATRLRVPSEAQKAHKRAPAEE